MNRVSIVVCLVLAGCGSTNGPEPSAYVVTDSAGVEIVQNGSAGFLGADLLDLRLELQLGAIDGPEPLQFHRVTAIAVDPDGTILVGNNDTAQVRRFRADGSYAGTLGRRGAGPGEFL